MRGKRAKRAADAASTIFHYRNGRVIKCLVGPILTAAMVPDRGMDLTTVHIGTVVKSIGRHAFHNCRSLRTVHLGSSREIGRSAFSGCYSLSILDLGDVIAIEPFAFHACTALSTVHLPDSVTNVAIDAFKHCTSLHGIALPDSVVLHSPSFGNQVCRFHIRMISQRSVCISARIVLMALERVGTRVGSKTVRRILLFAGVHALIRHGSVVVPTESAAASASLSSSLVQGVVDHFLLKDERVCCGL